jgi:hypothetical protein
MLTFMLLSCSKEDNSQPLAEVQSDQVINLLALQSSDYTTNPPSISGDFIKFDFSSGSTTTSDTDWDIAFRGTTILVNGGSSTGLTSEPERNGNAAVYMVEYTFANVTSINDSSFKQDSSEGLAIPTGSGNGWYSYNPTTHLISPIAGKVLIFRTADDLYAKVEILSYYKDKDPSSDGQHYTFDYVYQPNEGVTNF